MKFKKYCPSLLLICLLYVCICTPKTYQERWRQTANFDLHSTKLANPACISCGPGHSGQCFGPNICCGPFGCHLGTQETLRCQREGMFHEREPCISGTAFCRRNTGRCASEGICCTQDSCYTDKACSMDEKPRLSITDIGPLDLFPLVNYPLEYANEK